MFVPAGLEPDQYRNSHLGSQEPVHAKHTTQAAQRILKVILNFDCHQNG